MLIVHDFSHLPVDVAHKKLITISHRIYSEQYHQSWFLKSTNPIEYLRFEIIAFWEGRVQTITGWNDIVGQIVKPILDGVRGIVQPLFDWLWGLISPAIEGIKAFVKPLFDWLWSVIQGAINSVVAGVQGVSNFLTGFWNNIIKPGIQAIFTTYKAVWDSAVSFAESASKWAQNAYNAIYQAWDGIVETVSGAFEAVSKSLAAMPQAIAAAFQRAMDHLKDVLQWVWEQVLVPWGKLQAAPIHAMAETAKRLFDTVWDAFITAMEAIAPIEPEKALPTALYMLKFTGVSAISNMAGMAMADLIHPIKDIIPPEIKTLIYDITRFRDILEKVAGTFTSLTVSVPLKYRFNELFQPYVPRPDEAKRMMWRGVIKEKDYTKILEYHGFGPRWIEGFKELAKEIPSVSDLVKFVVKEVALMPPDYPTPKFFIDAMKKIGYIDYWARAYWWAHWILPAPGLLYDAFHRGVITGAELDKYLYWHDYNPDPRPGVRISDIQIMRELIYKLPDKLDARWMRRWGIIDYKDHEWLLKAGGLHPKWLTKVALAEKMNMLIDERTEVKSAFRSQFLLGLISAPILQGKLREIYYTAEEVEMLMKAAEERFRVEITKDAIMAIKYSYRLGYITKEVMASQLYALGITHEKVQAITRVEIARAIEMKRETLQEAVYVYGRDIAIRRFREGITTERELENELRMIGYQERQIPHMMVVARLHRDYDFCMTVLKYAKTAYKKGRITDTGFIDILKRFGFTPEKIQLELGLLKLAFGIGLKEDEIPA